MWLAVFFFWREGEGGFFSFPSSHYLKHVSDSSVSGILKTKETVLSREEKLNSLSTSVLE